MSDTPTLWAIELRYPEVPTLVYAGFTADNSVGWAPTLETAARFATKEIALRFVNNSYGPATAKYAHPVQVPA